MLDNLIDNTPLLLIVQIATLNTFSTNFDQLSWVY